MTLSALFDRLLGQDREAARAIAETMMRCFPYDWRGIDHLGHYYSVVGDGTRALALAREAHAMDPKHGGLTCRVGELLLVTGAYADAATWLEEAAELWSDVRPWHLRVEALERAGRRSEAKRIAQDAIVIFPENQSLREQFDSLVAGDDA